MKAIELKNELEKLFEDWSGEKADVFSPMDSAGSNRKIL